MKNALNEVRKQFAAGGKKEPNALFVSLDPDIINQSGRNADQAMSTLATLTKGVPVERVNFSKALVSMEALSKIKAGLPITELLSIHLS